MSESQRTARQRGTEKCPEAFSPLGIYCRLCAISYSPFLRSKTPPSVSLRPQRGRTKADETVMCVSLRFAQRARKEGLFSYPKGPSLFQADSYVFRCSQYITSLSCTARLALPFGHERSGPKGSVAPLGIYCLFVPFGERSSSPLGTNDTTCPLAFSPLGIYCGPRRPFTASPSGPLWGN